MNKTVDDDNFRTIVLGLIIARWDEEKKYLFLGDVNIIPDREFLETLYLFVNNIIKKISYWIEDDEVTFVTSLWLLEQLDDHLKEVLSPETMEVVSSLIVGEVLKLKIRKSEKNVDLPYFNSFLPFANFKQKMKEILQVNISDEASMALTVFISFFIQEMIESILVKFFCQIFSNEEEEEKVFGQTEKIVKDYFKRKRIRISLEYLGFLDSELRNFVRYFDKNIIKY